jgi:hypothetical protein
VPTKTTVVPSNVPSKTTSVTAWVSCAEMRRGAEYSATPVSGGLPTPLTVACNAAALARSIAAPLPCDAGRSTLRTSQPGVRWTDDDRLSLVFPGSGAELLTVTPHAGAGRPQSGIAQDRGGTSRPLPRARRNGE